MTMRRTDRRGGYIMFEALAALVLAGLVLTAVPLASGMLIRNWERATASSDTVDELATGLAVMRRELTVLQRVRWPKKKDEGGGVAFVGTPQTLGFVLPGNRVRIAPGQSAGDRIVMFTANTDENGSMLMRGSVPYTPGIQGFETVQLEDPVILLNGPWQYKFFYGESVDGQFVWNEAWEDEKKLPAAVRLDVVNFATGTRVIPPLVVRFKIDADPGCINDGAGPCRA